MFQAIYRAAALHLQGRCLLCCVLTVFLFSSAIVPASAQPVPPSHVLYEGEDLVYNVRYGPFDLGSVRVRTVSHQLANNHLMYYCKAFIDSYPKVPFVDLHAVFESYIDTTIYSHRFIGRMKQDEYWNFARYTFNYDRKYAILEKGQRDTAIVKRDSVGVDRVYQDGLSLFFFARDQLFSGTTLNIPTMVNEQKANTRIVFDGRRDAVEIDAVDYPVDVVGFEGTADFVGIFGMTGDFEGWFSNDDARIPVMAKMKVILGSITIELMQWKRPGWAPPRAKG